MDFKSICLAVAAAYLITNAALSAAIVIRLYWQDGDAFMPMYISEGIELAIIGIFLAVPIVVFSLWLDRKTRKNPEWERARKRAATSRSGPTPVSEKLKFYLMPGKKAGKS